MWNPTTPSIHDTAECHNTAFTLYNKVGAYSVIENSFFDSYAYCEPYCVIQNTHIGRFTDIARNCRIGATQHPINRPTSHHITYRRIMYDASDTDDVVFLTQRTKKITEIGHDVWIGHGVIIEAGIRIGNGAVIGSGAVVTHDIPDYAVAAGVPAKILRFRFDKQQIEELQRIAWWNWEDSAFRERLDDFSLDINAFIDKYRKEDKDGQQTGTVKD